MASRTVEIADAVVDFLNDNPSSFGLAFTAIRRTVPYTHLTEITSTPLVIVSPAESTRQPESRNADVLTYSIAIHLFRAIDPATNSDSDEMLELVEDIMTQTSRVAMSGANFLNSEWETVLDPDAFMERSQFSAVITLNYRN